MQPARLTHRQRAQLRQLPINQRQRQFLLPVRRQHLLLPAHPVRARSRRRVLNRLRHRPDSKMNSETMKPLARHPINLVGRGSRSTECCFRSPRRFDKPDFNGPINPPSRCSSTCHAGSCNPKPQTLFQHSSRWARLGETIGIAHTKARTSQTLCENRSAVPEPRPTNFTRHYVCS